eukprot:CAMPEP_0206481418 /NCGR_PEP_ID=MMETSP0324_2-20121206/38130_1 /ASSEMBLY_ACC=CAM_ASM_000836 /TAXON_ID=2866 /ORGANISM="Crypthecodinium cohnii, Strain Seligo" /LENGTH=64 /DNA_ID=CAMNT_0053958897 /DNA_START=662 /DNA_END=853 /DNA_ORIENTATION=+
MGGGTGLGRHNQFERKRAKACYPPAVRTCNNKITKDKNKSQNQRANAVERKHLLAKKLSTEKTA